MCNEIPPNTLYCFLTCCVHGNSLSSVQCFIISSDPPFFFQSIMLPMYNLKADKEQIFCNSQLQNYDALRLRWLSSKTNPWYAWSVRREKQKTFPSHHGDHRLTAALFTKRVICFAPANKPTPPHSPVAQFLHLCVGEAHPPPRPACQRVAAARSRVVGRRLCESVLGREFLRRELESGRYLWNWNRRLSGWESCRVVWRRGGVKLVVNAMLPVIWVVRASK